MKTTLVMLATMTACFRYSEPPVEPPAPKLRNIAEATILDMKVSLYKQKGLCPGMQGKLYADAMVQWPGSEPVKRNIGSDVDSLQPTSFQVSGPLVKGDANAHLHPSADVLASVETGFRAKIVYAPLPKFTFDVEFPPEYTCFTGFWDNGTPGRAGLTGSGGANGDWGQNGGPAGHGTEGGFAGRGGRVSAFVTIVRTKFHPKLIAVIANNVFFLAPPDVPLTFGAVGGQGGPGGDGGQGGAGGNQATESREVWDPDANAKVNKWFGVGGAGNGGAGGNGASGGRGGDGGTVEVIYDSRFPELARLIRTDVRGGAGGEPGAAGSGGNGGNSDAEQNAVVGAGGPAGVPGEYRGQDGRAGSQRVKAGEVFSKFAKLRGIELAGGRK